MAAFEGCTSLKEVHIPNGIPFLNREMLKGCDSLLRLSLPPSINVIHEEAIVSKSLRQLVIEGNAPVVFNTYLLFDCPNLEQLVFLKNPPRDPFKKLLKIVVARPTIYYHRSYARLWAPNGETEWYGFPLVPIDSLNDLPPITGI